MHDIVHELTIAAPPDAVFDAVTTRDGLASWWTTDCQAEPAEGSEATFGFDGRSVVIRMRIDALEPPELVHWLCIDGPDEWVGTSVAFRIEPAHDTPGSSVVRLWHGGWEYEDGLLPRCSFQWAMYLESLRRYLETGTGSPNTD
ncbi:MAG: SRPBCC domain-containing protein [Acidimicrobiales bacterium]|nr:SRPBCC domain-containing protein [Acidimicrobiales bacterium]